MLVRLAAVAAVLAAVVILALLIFSGSGAYEARVVFQNAGQLVKGNQVTVSGRPVGTVKDIRLTDEGHAEILLELKRFTPLHQGTTATSAPTASTRTSVAPRSPGSGRRVLPCLTPFREAPAPPRRGTA